MLFNGYANSNILSIEFWKELLKPYFTSEVLWAPFIFLLIYFFIYSLSYLNKKIFYVIVFIPLVTTILAIIEQAFFK